MTTAGTSPEFWRKLSVGLVSAHRRRLFRKPSHSSPLSVTLSWSVTDYQRQLPASMHYSPDDEADLRQRFPPLGAPSSHAPPGTVGRLLEGPAVITDNGGRILAWILPGIILPHRCVNDPVVYHRRIGS